MKKISLKKFLLIFVLTLSLFSIFGIMGNAKTSKAEGEVPSYYFVTLQKAVFSGTEITGYENEKAPVSALENNTAILLSNEKKNRIVVSLGETGDDVKYSIKNSMWKIVINDDVSFESDSTSFKSAGFELETLSSQINLIINPYAEGVENFIYGKYSIQFSYYYVEEDAVYTTFTHTFYVLEESKYINSESYQIDYNDSEGYYYNNFNTKSFPRLGFNYLYSNVTIEKDLQGLTYITKLSNVDGELVVSSTNERGESTDQHYIDFIKRDDGNVSVIFKNLGEYYITYERINPKGNNEVITKFFNDVIPNNNAQIKVFGYQAYYTTGTMLQEFKEVDSSFTIKQSADVSTKISISNGKLTFLDGDLEKLKASIVKTNQAPVYFMTNSNLAKDESGNILSNHYYFKTLEDLSDNLTGGNIVKNANYADEPIEQQGYHLVEIIYNFAGNIKNFKQYFLFEITHESPAISIETNEETAIAISNNDCTNKDVVISKTDLGVFDTPSVVKVYKDSTFTGKNFEELTTVSQDGVVLNQSAKYKVELIYGNNKGYITFFTVDKLGITDVKFYNANNIGGSLYDRGTEVVGATTNQPIILQWANKVSSQTYAEYKFIPTKYSVEHVNKLTSNELITMYNSNGGECKAIPASYVINSSDFVSKEIPKSTYTNMEGENTFQQNNVLTEGGLYIFRIYDETGTEVFKPIFLDDTKNNIMIYTDYTYQIVNADDMTTKDIEVYFGKSKYIQFTESSVFDSWFNKILSQEEFSEFNKHIVEYRGQRYFDITVNNEVYYSIQGIVQEVYKLAENNYKLTISSKLENNVPNENQYIFYTICDSTQDTSIFSKGSFEYYENNYTAMYSVVFSTDNSNMKLNYTNAEGKVSLLVQSSVETRTEKGQGIKTNFYEPTAETTLSTQDVLEFSYCVIPSDEIKVQSIIVKYYPFTESDSNATYIFNTEALSTTELFVKDSFNNGTLINAETNTYKWIVGVENYEGSKTRTKAGKYVIVRTYTNDSEAYLDENDPKVRELVFIVDRNGVISSPKIDSDGNSIYYTGSAIRLQVVNNYQGAINSDTLFFYDIYFASKLNSSSGTFIPVLTTNLLPVTLYVPTYKYGYDNLGMGNNKTPNFNKEDSIIVYGKESNNYKGYELSSTVEYYINNNMSSKPVETFILNTPTKFNYLTTVNSSGLISFNKPGYYKATISSKAGDTFSFVFQIEEATPKYTITNTDNSIITQDANGVYYTNKSSLRVAWEDSQNKFLATINQDEISYTINGFKGKLDTTKTPIHKVAGENSYYFDLDLESLGAYQDNTTITITLQFKGISTDYLNPESFSKTTKIVVDLQAPTSNLGRLISTTGLSFNDLREYVAGYGNKYSTSKTSGLMQYYSYTIDKENLATLLLSPQETNYDFYKAYYKIRTNGELNTKYVAGYEKELDVLANDLRGLATSLYEDADNNFLSLARDENICKYIDIVEEDYAGNRSVYTILITDYSSNLKQEVLEYYKSSNKDVDVKDLLQSITYEELLKNIQLYSKYKFNIENIDFINSESIGTLSWQIINVNGKKYVKNPYSNGKYYSYDDYKEGEENLQYVLSSITTLSANANSQSIELFSVPKYSNVNIDVYVLNQALEVYSLAQVYENDLIEGIAIKLPNINAGENNTLYATNLTIKGNINGVALEEFDLSDYTYEGYLREELAELPKIPGYEIYYLTYRGSRYFVIEIKNDSLRVNDYFIYTYIDNYGEEYAPLVHIYGQQDISNPIESEGTIVETYDDLGKLVYYSTEDITYKFDSTIYNSAKILLSINGRSSLVYHLTKSRNSLILNKEGETESITPNEDGIYDNYFKLKIVNNVIFVTMLADKYEFEDKEFGYGGDYRYEIILEPNADFKIEDVSVNFEIYNKLPTIILLSKNGDDVSIVFANNYYLDSITVSYTKTVLKFPYEILVIDNEGNTSELENNKIFNIDGIYKIVVNYLGDIKGCSKTLEFTIASSSNFKYSVVKHLENGMYQTVSMTGAPFTYQELEGAGAGARKTIANHYIVNGEYDIRTNANLNIKYEAIEETDVKPINGHTYLYRIYNTADDLGLVTELYSTVIAITKVEKSSRILNKFIQYDNKGVAEDIDISKSTSTTSHVITKEEYDDGKKIYWSKYSVIPENKINIEIYYGDANGSRYYPEIREDSDTYNLTLKTSGVYYIKFYDMAGNVQLFGAYSDNEFYIIKYVSSVIFEVEGQTPINYAIYDHEVVVSIPETTLSYYDGNARPSINVELNGVLYDDYEKLSNYSWKFNQEGLYKITFTAKINEENVYEAPLYFTILSSEETRLTYSYSGYGDYYIKDLLLNGVSVYNNLANMNHGEMYDGQYLKNIKLHYYDAKTGGGSWTFVVYANNEFKQEFRFSVWINKANVPIVISVNNGESTTHEIKVELNVENVLSDVGDCILRVTGFNDFYITKDRLERGEIGGAYTVSITKTGKYYIEITTLSGQLLFSQYVEKTEPLNTISIILIVVGSLVVISGVTMFILLRKKMKIR